MADRPNAMAELNRLLEARAPLYEQARLVIETEKIGPRACVERLLGAIAELAG